MKVYELTGAQLDHWVARALGYEHHGAVGVFEDDQSGKPFCRSQVNDWWKDQSGAWLCGPCEGFPCAFSSDWAQGGHMIERECISITKTAFGGRAHLPCWSASMVQPVMNAPHRPNCWEGPTPLIAAMRAYVASKFGDEVPDA